MLTAISLAAIAATVMLVLHLSADRAGAGPSKYDDMDHLPGDW